MARFHSSFLLLFPLLASIAPVLNGAVDFNRQIRPILSNNCFECHGPDRGTREADLRLDQEAEAMEVIIRGNAARSLLIRVVTADDPADRMPPPDSGKTLSQEEIALLKQWIDEGAEWKEHWAFLPAVQPDLPEVSDPDWARNGIDRFVLATLQAEGLEPAPEAEKATLLRRVTLDLTGLPPSVEEIEAFLSDDSADAYEKAVDRLLASPRYGEHMAGYWLDLARYADTNGYQYDTERIMWRWRDWVIDAYNNNMPFDQFTVEQLAGDLLPEPTLEQKIATGFNRNHGITIEGGIIEEEYRTEYVMDRVDTTSTVWMGLTMNCARCHDHKYDPVSQEEFYQFYAFFNQVDEGGFGARPQIKAPTREQQQKLNELNERILAADARVQTQLAGAEDERRAWEERISARASGSWNVVEPLSMSARGGTTLKKLEDHSILASGENPETDLYEIVAKTDKRAITGIRLEALTHDSLPHKGPGRSGNANFVLTEFELEAVSVDDPALREKITFSSADADHSQENFPVAHAVDGQIRPTHGWAVDGNLRRETRTAIFIAEKPFGFEGGTELHFRLRHESQYSSHSIGRSRLSVTEDPHPAISVDIMRIAALPVEDRSEEEKRLLMERYLETAAPPDLREAREHRTSLDAELEELNASIPTTKIMRDRQEKRPTYLLTMGEYDRPQSEVQAGTPATLPPMPDGAPMNRLGFAQWLVQPEHPLTARVSVNRYWQKYFGLGIVKTAEDFGIQSEWPSHPELLDWLATTFVASGWDVKGMQRLIVTSATYRQSSRISEELLEIDPENRLFARGPRLRMRAEMIRDSALSNSGLLVEKVGGPSVYPYQPPGLWTEVNNRPGFSQEYPQGTGESLYRRSLYTFWKRAVPAPAMLLFDAPEREYCVVRRSFTTTPLQALALMHDPQHVEAARHLAERILTEPGTTTAERIAFAFQVVTSREATSSEVAIIERVFHEQLAEYKADTQAAERLLLVGDSERNQELDLIEHAAWTAISRMIMNLDEAIVKG